MAASYEPGLAVIDTAHPTLSFEEVRRQGFPIPAEFLFNGTSHRRVDGGRSLLDVLAGVCFVTRTQRPEEANNLIDKRDTR